MTLSLILGGAIVLLGTLLIKAYVKIGELKKMVVVNENLFEDAVKTNSELIKRLQDYENINSEPVAGSIGDALDGMSKD